MRMTMWGILAISILPQLVFGWDTQNPAFPTNDVPYIDLKPAAPATTIPYLGYYPTAAMDNSLTGSAWAMFTPANAVSCGFPTGKPYVVRATLALMDDAQQTILFPDWNPAANWIQVVSPNIWVTAGGDLPSIQRQYELFMRADPAQVMKAPDLVAAHVGNATVSTSPPTTLAPYTIPNAPCFQQNVANYNIYGNALPSYAPTTLADEGPPPTKDERAWPLPSDLCIPPNHL